MTSHHDVAGVVAELRDPNAHYTSETGGDINLDRYIRWLLARCFNAADLLESQAKALSEAEDKNEQLQRTLLSEQKLAYGLPVELRKFRDRALAAEARLAEAMKLIEPFVEIADECDEFQDVIDFSDDDRISIVQTGGCHIATLSIGDFRAARAFTNAAKEKT